MANMFHSTNVCARVSVFYSNRTHTWFHCVPIQRNREKCSLRFSPSRCIRWRGLRERSTISPNGRSQGYFIMDKFYYIALVLRRLVVSTYTPVLGCGSASNELQLVRAGARDHWTVIGTGERIWANSRFVRRSGWVPFYDIRYRMRREKRVCCAVWLELAVTTIKPARLFALSYKFRVFCPNQSTSDNV